MASLVTEQDESEQNGSVDVPHVLISYPLEKLDGTIIEHQIKVPVDNNDLAEDDLNEEKCNILLTNLCLPEHISYISGFLIINNKHFFGYGRKKRVQKGVNPLHVETTMMLTLLKVVKNKSIENISSLRLYSTLQPCCMCSLVIHQVVAKIKQIQSVDHIECKVYYGIVDKKMIKYDSRNPNLGNPSRKKNTQHKTHIWNHNCVPYSNKGKKLCNYTSNQMFDKMLKNDKMLTYAIDSPTAEKASNKSWGFYNTLKDLFSTKSLIHDQDLPQLVVGEDGSSKLSTLRVDALAFVPMSATEEEEEEGEKKEDKKTEQGPKYGYDRTLNNEVIFQYLKKPLKPKANHGKLFNFVNAMNLTTEKDKKNIFWMFLPGNLECREGQIEIRDQKNENKRYSQKKSLKNISNSIHNYCNLKAFYWEKPTSLLSMRNAPSWSPTESLGNKNKKSSFGAVRTKSLAKTPTTRKSNKKKNTSNSSSSSTSSSRNTSQNHNQRKFRKSRKTTKESKTKTKKIDQREGKKIGRKVISQAATLANTRTKSVASAAATSKENAVNCIVKVSTKKKPRNAKICGLNSVKISSKKRKTKKNRKSDD